MTDKQPEALQVPLHELLEAIPEDWRIGVKDNDDWSAGTTWHPVGVMCHQAATELRRLHEVNAELVGIFKRIRFEQGFACECGIEDATWDLIEAVIAKSTGEQQ
jgi:hypothetical protein